MENALAVLATRVNCVTSVMTASMSRRTTESFFANVSNLIDLDVASVILHI